MSCDSDVDGEERARVWLLDLFTPLARLAHLSFIQGCYESARTRTHVGPKEL